MAKQKTIFMIAAGACVALLLASAQDRPTPSGGSAPTAAVEEPGKPEARSGVSQPVPIYRPDPGYTREARKAKYQGSVILTLVVDKKGIPRNVRVVKPLGLGLDKKAVEAVKRWRFRPGTRGGKPVDVPARVEVNFRLL